MKLKYGIENIAGVKKRKRRSEKRCRRQSWRHRRMSSGGAHGIGVAKYGNGRGVSPSVAISGHQLSGDVA
jgi:hypothetical protein